MTPARRRLVALAAALAPARADALLGHLGGGRDEARALAAALSTAPRRARLAALAATLPREADPGPGGSHPLLARLSRERVAGAAAARAEVRRTAASPAREPSSDAPSALARGVDSRSA